MAFDLPAFTPEAFRSAVARHSPEPLSARALDALWAHYEELRRWNRRLGLVGPGTAEEVVSRHYGESLAALPLVPGGPLMALDLGSGAGFPGLVLAAARPELDLTLVEARERKWSFLLSAARRAALPCRALDVRVRAPLPAGLPERLDLVTSRALKLPVDLLAALAERLSAAGRLLLWVGEHDPDLPPALALGRSLPLPGSDHRRVLELRPAGGEPRTLDGCPE